MKKKEEKNVKKRNESNIVGTIVVMLQMRLKGRGFPLITGTTALWEGDVIDFLIQSLIV